jgi:hypothetical protein
MRGINHREDFGWSNAPRFGGGGGGGTTTQTTNQNTTPWSGQAPYLSELYGLAEHNYTSAQPNYYPNSTYVPMTGLQNNIATGVEARGLLGGNEALNGANSTLASTLSPGYTAGTAGGFQAGQNALTSMANGSYGNSASGAMGSGIGALGSIAGGNYQSAASPAFNAANSVLGNELSAGYLNPWNSPSFGTVVNNTLASVIPASVIPATTASFINGGRSDSGLAQRAATMAATDAVGNLAQNQYQANQAIQNAAVGQASQNNQNAVGNAINAAGQAGSLYGTIGGLQQGAANSATANYLTQQGNQLKGAALAPGVDQQQMGDLTTALQTAGMTQQDQQAALNADIQRWNYGQMLPWNQLGMFENAVVGTGSPGSTTTGTQQTPYYTNPVANAASAASGLGSLGMLAFTMLSDARAKTDITPIGQSDSGFPLYMFRYKGEPPNAMHIGLMAQDVAQRKPEAVIKTPSGLLAVDYSKALAA